MTLGQKTFVGFLFSIAMLICFAFLASISSMIAAKKTMASGVDTLAEITRVKKTGGGRKALYRVAVSWTDTAGRPHGDVDLLVSETFWAQMTSDGLQTTGQAAIRYRADDPEASPVIVADYDAQLQHQWYAIFIIGGPALFMSLYPFQLLRRMQRVARPTGIAPSL